jgi:hypothetical protein
MAEGIPPRLLRRCVHLGLTFTFFVEERIRAADLERRFEQSEPLSPEKGILLS